LAARVELRNVTKTFGRVRALVQASLSLEAGHVTVIRGPNGSGKSTALAIVGTLARPSSGRVIHEGLGVGRAEVRASLGWVGHDSLCYPDLTGRENLALAARLHGRDADSAIDRASERFSLAAFIDRPVRTYSRGQRQRVALARALLHAPKLLLLDEPTTGLDEASTRGLEGVARSEAERGAIVVVVTHDPAFAKAVGDRTYELDRGRVVTG
jgi:heme exporter protein A